MVIENKILAQKMIGYQILSYFWPGALETTTIQLPERTRALSAVLTCVTFGEPVIDRNTKDFPIMATR